MEIEAKFIVPDDPTFQRLIEVDTLAGLRLGRARVKVVHDRYLDTATRCFLLGGYACRLRDTGDACVVTLKSIGQPSSALHRREEFEVRLTPAQAAGPVDLWPPSEASDLARMVSAGQPLELLFEMHQERHVRLALRPGESQPQLEISVDRVSYDDGSSASIYEFEAEVLPAGQVADLELLIAELPEHWSVLPQTASKFEQGLALCCPDLLAELKRY